MACGLWTSASFGQTSGVMNFDGGGDGSSWDDAINWEHVAETDGTPTSGNPPTPPVAGYTANIPIAGAVLDNTMPGQTAFRVRTGVGTAGSFTVTGGSLAVADDISVGHSAQGTMLMSGGMVSLGDDFFIDEQGNFGSTFTMTGGALHIVDRLVMGNQGHLTVDGGTITAEDDFFLLGNSTVTINSGLMATIDKLNNGNATPTGPARLKINGGIMRSNEWTDDPELEFNDPTRFTSIIEINGTGKMQVEQASMPVAEALGLIAAGRFTTSALSPLGLGVQTVVVPEFFGRTNVVFTQISVVPEPASMLLAGLGGLALVRWRRRN